MELTPPLPARPLSADPSRSHTLPSRWYINPDVVPLERSAVFARSWLYVGHQSQLVEPGSYLTVTVTGQDLMVIRSDDGTLGAFHNVCQHRGHQLLNGAGRVRSIACPYHAWVYGIDGQLKQARNTAEMVNFDKADFGLSAVQVEVMCGLVFVNLDLSAPSLASQTDGLEAEIRSFCPEIDSVLFVRRDRFEVESNWKTMVENFLECYHCAPAHRDFVDLVDMPSYRSVVHGIWSSHVSNAPGTEDNSAFTIETGRTDFSFAGWFVWPNLTIWIYPGDAQVSILQMNPDGPEQTIEYQDWFCPGGSPTPQLREAMDYQKDVLQPEDISLCESVQRGLRSDGYDQGRFVVDTGRTELSEHAVHHFQIMVAKALGVPVEK